jgi:broad specificity phosphatase PhoE
MIRADGRRRRQLRETGRETEPVTLYLVRHAMPQVDPATDPATWPLGADGRVAARLLRRRLPPGAFLVASDEPKAWQTVAQAGERSVLRDARLREVRRTEEFSEDFRLLRRSYVSGAAIRGWEPRLEVARRFAAAIEGATARAGDRDVVAASHGMAMTVWLAETLRMTDPGSFWADLRFPDALVVDPQAGTVTRVWS